MRLVIIALLLAPTVSNAETMPSGLDDPFASKVVCLELAHSIEQGEGDPVLHSIAISDSIITNNLYRFPMVMMANDGIYQNPDNGPINAVLLRSACREVFP